MGENTGISWADYTFNPWIGCQKVSEGCKFCYAERENGRFGWVSDFAQVRKVTSEGNWAKVQKWNKGQWWECSICGARWDEFSQGHDPCGHVAVDNYDAAVRTRGRVFCASLADVFEWRADGSLLGAQRRLFNLIDETPNLDWMLLTKRPQKVIIFLSKEWLFEHRNVWIGTSAENQSRANERIPELIKIPAWRTFVSLEPLLGPIDLVQAVGEGEEEDYAEADAILDQNGDSEPEECIEENELECDWINYGDELVHNPAYDEWHKWRDWRASLAKLSRTVDWVIVGGESGYRENARVCEEAWVVSLRDQCQLAKIWFHFKQWGDAQRLQNGIIGRDVQGKVWNEFPLSAVKHE